MSTPVQNATLPELVRTIADDARELVKAEVGLAKDEMVKRARLALVAVAGATAGTVVAVLVMCTFVAAGVLALGGSEVAALSAAAAWGALLVTTAVIVAVRLLSRGQSEQVATPSVRAPGSEPRLTNSQSEVVR